ncbi:hypothetical protein N8987_02110 [Crocinitomix sp.]|jgi:hypothetical protein|nr:hypothetical protein [Crocinitomix sp.]
MYASQLENLIEMALIDGELTEKEKKILFKKAEELDIDLDEFEMVLNARLFEKNKTVSQKKPVTIIDQIADRQREVKKCPSCGAITQSFTTNCSDCGTEFRNVEASRNITLFFEKLNELESNRKDSLFDNQKVDPRISVGTIIKWWLFWWVLLPLKIIAFIINKSKPAKWSITDSHKEEMIMNFPVPNSREEIIEFITLAASKMQSVSVFRRFNEEGKYISKWNSIWGKKAEQVFTKAKLSMIDDKSTIQAIEQILIDAKVINFK